MIDELVATGARTIALTGGEFLLRPDALRIAAYAAGKLHTMISTNGTLISEQIAQKLAGLGVPVQVSLDGATAATHDRIRGPGAFERARRGIDLLLQSGIGDRLALCMTLMKWNLHEVPRSDREVVVQATLLGFAPDASESEPWCGLGRTLAVDADGDIYPCSMLMAPEFRLGSVEDTGLEEAMRSPRLRRLCEDCAARKTEIERCQTCTWRNFCQAGCPASVLAEKGTLWATDDLCEVRRELYRKTIFELAEQKQVALR